MNQWEKIFKLDVEQHDNRNIIFVAKLNSGILAITGTHTPHAGASDTQKDSYYNTLKDIHIKYGGKNNIHYLVGDFNARIINRAPAEEHIIGLFYLKDEDCTSDILSDNQKDNRKRFIEFSNVPFSSSLLRYEKISLKSAIVW